VGSSKQLKASRDDNRFILSLLTHHKEDNSKDTPISDFHISFVAQKLSVNNIMSH